MQYIKSGQTTKVMFKAVLSSDHYTPATGKSLDIYISRNGGAFAVPPSTSPLVPQAAEIGGGWYYIELSNADVTTAGTLIVRVNNAVAQSIDDVAVVLFVGNVPSDIQSVQTNSSYMQGLTNVCSQMANYNLLFARDVCDDDFGIVEVQTSSNLTSFECGDLVGLTDPGVVGRRITLRTTNGVQRRIITAFDNSTGKITFTPALPGSVLIPSTAVISHGDPAIPNAVAGAANGLHILGANVGDTSYTGVAGPAIAYTGSLDNPGASFTGVGDAAGLVISGPSFGLEIASGGGTGITVNGLVASLGLVGRAYATHADNDIRGITPKDGAITDASFTLPSSAENTMTGPPTGFMAMVLRIARKMRIIGSKVVRDRAAGTVSIRNNADNANLQVETHTSSGTTDTITRTS